MSAKRNPIIVNALDKADYIENYSTGVRRIFEDYIGFHKQPHFSISDNGVIVTLFNRNYDEILDKSVVDNVVVNVAYEEDKKRLLTERQKKIITLIKDNPQTTAQELSELLKVSSRTIQRDLAKLTKEGYIKHIGTDKDGDWVVINKTD
jgi:predicted HTH transcriptional regulator